MKIVEKKKKNDFVEMWSPASCDDLSNLKNL